MDDAQEKVVLVTPDDKMLGLMDKLQAHKNGILHRAFSVFLFDADGKILLQRRSASKYHSPNLWTNACCSHPRAHETYPQAAQRRMKEELGIETQVEEIFHFIYRSDVGEGLWEHERDHVFTGTYTGEFELNPKEVSQIRYLSFEDLDREISTNPEQYTQWFKIIWEEYRDRIAK